MRYKSVTIACMVFINLFGCSRGDGHKKHEHAEMNHDAVHDSLSHLVKPTDEVVIANVKTIKPQKGSRFENISVQGIIGYNENNLSSQSSRVSGRIERLYVKYNYQAISRGEKLMEIYSPDLVNAQQELLFLHQNNELELAEMAKRKLLLLGSIPQQISNLLKTGKVNYTFTIYSLISGYIVENLSTATETNNPAGSSVIASSSASGSSGNMAGMGSTASSAPGLPAVPESSPLQLREGQYISKGQTFLKIINSNEVWAEFYIHPEQLENFKRGTKISVTSSANEGKESVGASVSIVQPYYSSGESYPLVRAVLPNSRKSWRIGELIQVSKEEVKKEGVWLPRTAVLALGGRSVSFVKEEGIFVPVDVKVQGFAGDWVDIGESLGNKEVALNAWFLMDSESFVQVKNR